MQRLCGYCKNEKKSLILRKNYEKPLSVHIAPWCTSDRLQRPHGGHEPAASGGGIAVMGSPSQIRHLIKYARAREPEQIREQTARTAESTFGSEIASAASERGIDAGLGIVVRLTSGCRFCCRSLLYHRCLCQLDGRQHHCNAATERSRTAPTYGYHRGYDLL